jgi:metal-responsive CopG/Arc/MetJ family transcriptional regulator
MTEDPPDRITFSIPPDSDLDEQTLDDLVKQSDASSRSEFIRQAITENTD